MKRKLTLKNLIIVVLALVFIFGFIRQERAMARIEDQKTKMEAQLKELNEKNERLQEEHGNALTDEYLEQLARERLKMVKDGERVVDGKKDDSNSQK